MKNLTLILLVCLVYSLPAQWTGTYGSNQLFDIAFSTPTNGVAVGTSPGLIKPAISRTSNGGASWTTSTLNTGWDLYAVSAANASTYYACGTGVIFRSISSGSSWTAIPQPATGTDSIYLQIKFVDSLNGYVADGGSMFKTIDAGNSWTYFGKTISTPAIENMGVATASKVFSSVNQQLFRTFNGGVTWDTLTQTQMSIPLNEGIVKIFWSDSTQVFIATLNGNATRLYRSIDNGNTWTHVFSNAKKFIDIDASDINHLALVLSNMELYVSNNQGQSWSYVSPSSDNFGAIGSISYPAPGKVYGTGAYNLAFGVFSYGNIPTAMNELSVRDELLLYPNPAVNSLNWKSDLQMDHIMIYSIDGKLMSETEQPANSIDISGLAKGVYIAELKVSDAVQRVRWVKM
jgi:photosystem II stability/assembly factor-like uncharacterized protein